MSEVTYSKLEMTFEPSPDAGYRMSMGLRAPGADTDQRVAPTEIQLNPAQLNQLRFDIDEYSRTLTEQVFSNDECLTIFDRARTLYLGGSDLRIQIVISPETPELHEIVWEAMLEPMTRKAQPEKEPQPRKILSTSENIWLSRYLLSKDARLVSLRPKTELRAVALAANPENLNPKLAKVKADDEIKRFQDALPGIPMTTLGSAGAPRASLDNLLDTLRAGVDILYLVCHGVLTVKGPVLYLEDENGKEVVLPGSKLVESLAELNNLPRLVVLASCESAGKDEAGALAALGPRLAEAGVPAVLAMHGKISMDTVSLFMPAFFKELSKDGQVDHALAVARSLAHRHERVDAWMPVLFTRSISGRLWPDSTQTNATAAQMESLINVVAGLKDRPAGGINIQGENISIQGGVNYGPAASQPATPAAGNPLAPVEKARILQPFKLDVQAVLNSTPSLGSEELLEKYHEYKNLLEFVGRKDEYQQFKELIVTEVSRREQRLVAFYGQAGMGKSMLLDRIQFECVRQSIPTARVILESGDYNNVIEILRAIVNQLGKKEFSQWIELDDYWHSPPEIKVDIAQNEAAANTTAQLSMKDASISGGVHMGANVDLRGSQINVKIRAADNQKAAETALTETFLSILEEFVHERPVVLLFEGLDDEKCSEETKNWLIKTLLNKVRNMQGYGVLAVVTFVNPPILDRKLEVDTYESELNPLEFDEIIQYFRLRKIPENYVEPEARNTLAETEGVPARVVEKAAVILYKLKKNAKAVMPAPIAPTAQNLPATPMTTGLAEQVVKEAVQAEIQPEPAQPEKTASVTLAESTSMPAAGTVGVAEPHVETRMAEAPGAPEPQVMPEVETAQAVQVNVETFTEELQTSPEGSATLSDESAKDAEINVDSVPVAEMAIAEALRTPAEGSAETGREQEQMISAGRHLPVAETAQFEADLPAPGPVSSDFQAVISAPAELTTEPAGEIRSESPAEPAIGTAETAPLEDIPAEAEADETQVELEETPAGTDQAEAGIPENQAVEAGVKGEDVANQTAPATVNAGDKAGPGPEKIETAKSFTEIMMGDLLSESTAQLAQMAQKCAVLRWFSLETMKNIRGGSLSDRQAGELLDGILDWRVTQDLGQARYVFRKESGAYLRKRFRVEAPAEYRETLASAHAYFDSQLTGIDLYDEMAWALLSPDQVSALREKLYYLLMLDLEKGFELLNSLFQSAQRLVLLGEASTLIRFAQELDPADLPAHYQHRLAYYEAVLKFSSGDVEAALGGINSLLDELAGGAVEPELKAQILSLVGSISRNQKDETSALTAFEQAQKIWNSTGREREAAKLSNNLGNVYNSQKVFDKAEKAFRDALNVFKKVKALPEQAQTLNNLGNVYKNRREWDGAEDNYKKSLAIKQQIGDQYGTAHTLVNLGGVYASMTSGEIDKKQIELRGKALKCFQDALEIYSTLGSRSKQAETLRRQALLLYQGKQTEAAREKFGEAVQIYQVLKMWADLGSHDVQDLASKLSYPIEVEAPDRTAEAEAKTSTSATIPLVDVLQRVLKTEVLTAPPVVKAKPSAPVGPALAQVAAQVVSAPTKLVGATAKLVTAPAIKEKLTPLQELEAQTNPEVVARVKDGLASFSPPEMEAVKWAALLRVIDRKGLELIGQSGIEVPNVEALYDRMTNLPFVEALAPGQFKYRPEEQAYLRAALPLEHPEKFHAITRQLVEHYEKSSGGLEKLRAARELPPAEYFAGLREQLYYQLVEDLPAGMKFLGGLIPALVEKANQFKQINESAQNAPFMQILNEAAALVNLARESFILPAAEQDRLVYAEVLLDNATGRQDQAETKLRALQAKKLDDDLKAQVLSQLGLADTNKGNFEPAIKSFEQAQAIWTRLKRDLESAKISNALGSAYLRSKDFGRAEKAFQQALAGFNKLGSPADQSQALNNLGNMYSLTNTWDKAMEAYQKSLELKQSTGDQIGMATTQTNLGRVYQSQAQTATGKAQADLRAKAVEAYVSAIETFRKFSARALLGRAIFALSYLYAQMGQADQARKTLPEAIQIFSELGLPELANATKLAGSLGIK